LRWRYAKPFGGLPVRQTSTGIPLYGIIFCIAG
jgi:hypothetical protein